MDVLSDRFCIQTNDLFQLELTYVEVQREVNGIWETEYTDADWSTRFHWNTTNETLEDDVNLFSALFNVIADVTGLRFNFTRAKALFDEGDFGEVYENRKMNRYQLQEDR